MLLRWVLDLLSAPDSVAMQPRTPGNNLLDQGTPDAFYLTDQHFHALRRLYRGVRES